MTRLEFKNHKRRVKFGKFDFVNTELKKTTRAKVPKQNLTTLGIKKNVCALKDTSSKSENIT